MVVHLLCQVFYLNNLPLYLYFLRPELQSHALFRSIPRLGESLGDTVGVRGESPALHTFTGEALDVKVFVLDAQRLPFAGLPTVLTWDGSTSSATLLLLLLLQRAVDSLLLKHCRTHKDNLHSRYNQTFCREK